MKRLILLPLCLTLLLLGCGEKLPKPTQTGSNTFGCKIDGKKWVPNRGGSIFAPIKPISGGYLQMTSADGKKYVGIDILASSDDGQRVQILLNSRLPGVYNLNKDTQTRPTALSTADYGYYKSEDGATYITSVKYTGSVIINRSDTVNYIISGQFYFTAVNSKGETVKITEGRFDIKSPQ